MAKKIIVELVDDIDGSVIPTGKGEHIEFAVDGVAYEIDLSVKNAKDFRKQLDHYIEHAKKVGRQARRTAPARTSIPAKRDPAQTRAIREWANNNGYNLGGRGRIPAEVEDAFTAAN